MVESACKVCILSYAVLGGGGVVHQPRHASPALVL